MELKSTRKILSITLAIVIAISTLCYDATLIISKTMGSQKFVCSHIVSDELVRECEKQLDIKFDTLEKKSGIPSRVFQTVKTSYKTRDAMTQAAEYIFDVNDSTLYNDTKIDYFRDICIEYLEGNDIKYKDANIDVVAKEAARIYSDSVGIHNADAIKQFVATTNKNCSRIQSICALLTFICALLIVLMYKQRVNAYLYVAAGLIAGGFGTALGSLMGIIARVGANYAISPVAYQHSFYSMTRTSILFIMLFGLAVMILGIALFTASMYKIKVEKDRKDTRFSKVVVKL